MCPFWLKAIGFLIIYIIHCFFQTCKNVPRKVCVDPSPDTEPTCTEKIIGQECQNVTREEPKTICSQVPQENCRNVPKEVCAPIQRNICDIVPVEKAVQNCRFVPKYVVLFMYFY